MKLKCIHCGEEFTPPKEDQQALANGEYDIQPICDECFEMINQVPEPDYFSDADPGL